MTNGVPGLPCLMIAPVPMYTLVVDDYVVVTSNPLRKSHEIAQDKVMSNITS